jgi:hypothetical protein
VLDAPAFAGDIHIVHKDNRTGKNTQWVSQQFWGMKTAVEEKRSLRQDDRIDRIILRIALILSAFATGSERPVPALTKYTSS